MQENKGGCLVFASMVILIDLLFVMIFVNIRTVLGFIIGILAFGRIYKIFENEAKTGIIAAFAVCLLVILIADVSLGVNIWLSIVMAIVESLLYSYAYISIIEQN